MMLPSIAASGVAKSLMAVTISMHPAAAHHGSHYVTVKPGNTLSSISQQAYGSSADWPALWWVNRHNVRDPSSLRVGQRLRLSAWHPQSAWLTRDALGAGTAKSAAPAAASSAELTSAGPTQTYSAASGSFQSCVIEAESGGDPSAVNPSTGAGGLYGFLPSTWQALGFSGLPEDASVAEQNAAFAKEYAESGASAWAAYDGC
jgi:resuscitation-promoting factor RpfC